ncbi:MAG: CRISPR-associated helicase Cas3' [bacterium]
MIYYAHTSSIRKPELLKHHLSNVAEQARKFALSIRTNQDKFSDAAWLAGMLHDLGKYRTEFQEYLFGKREGSQDTHHAFYGAAAACYNLRNIELLFAIAGHHAGLHNHSDIQQGLHKYQAQTKYPELIERLIDDFGELPQAIETASFQTDQEKLAIEVRIRLLFSCLVDADRLETARYEKMTLPESKPFEPGLLLDKLLTYIKTLDNKESALGLLRRQILESALARGKEPQGFFSMTVPTGGGKTLSSMAFALAHARTHGLQRVIVVIPYTSIIEQNAEVYRKVFGADLLLEHHSSVKLRENEDESKQLSNLELAVENWDAPIIVTTQVQLLESLLSRSPHKCRKLHNIARSVIILDEVQTLPYHLLDPVLSVFQELCQNYGTSILLCSATQPVFQKSYGLPYGLESAQVREIAPDPPKLFQQLQRVTYHLPQRNEKLSWLALTEKLRDCDRFLVVVSTRKQAFQLWEAVKASLPPEAHDTVFHLSSSMCAAHRLAVIGTIKARLEKQLPCRVVSTQLIEAGVDLDFPVVYRALGPLDSIVQAAGRCNREGKLPGNGQVHVFVPEDNGLPGGSYKTATNNTDSFFHTPGMAEQMACDPAVFSRYFSSLFQVVPTDAKKTGGNSIQENRIKFNFKRVSETARVIKDTTTALIVPYGEAAALISRIREKPYFSRDDWRSFQRYTVAIRNGDMNELISYNGTERLRDDVDIHVAGESFYHQDVGLMIKAWPLKELIV